MLLSASEAFCSTANAAFLHLGSKRVAREKYGYRDCFSIPSKRLFICEDKLDFINLPRDVFGVLELNEVCNPKYRLMNMI